MIRSPRMIERANRIKAEKRKQFVIKWLVTPLAVILFILAVGYVGEQDRQTEMLERGYNVQN